MVFDINKFINHNLPNYDSHLLFYKEVKNFADLIFQSPSFLISNNNSNNIVEIKKGELFTEIEMNDKKIVVNSFAPTNTYFNYKNIDISKIHHKTRKLLKREMDDICTKINYCFNSNFENNNDILVKIVPILKDEKICYLDYVSNLNSFTILKYFHSEKNNLTKNRKIMYSRAYILFHNKFDTDYNFVTIENFLISNVNEERGGPLIKNPVIRFFRFSNLEKKYTNYFSFNKNDFSFIIKDLEEFKMFNGLYNAFHIRMNHSIQNPKIKLLEYSYLIKDKKLDQRYSSVSFEESVDNIHLYMDTRYLKIEDNETHNINIFMNIDYFEKYLHNTSGPSRIRLPFEKGKKVTTPLEFKVGNINNFYLFYINGQKYKLEEYVKTLCSFLDNKDFVKFSMLYLY